MKLLDIMLKCLRKVDKTSKLKHHFLLQDLSDKNCFGREEQERHKDCLYEFLIISFLLPFLKTKDIKRLLQFYWTRAKYVIYIDTHDVVESTHKDDG
jgi:hypothetical protein